MKKMLAMLLALCMILSMAPAMAENTAEKGTIIYGSSTEIGGDFWYTSYWTNNATDKMIRDMADDTTTVVTDQGGALVVNPTVTADLTTTENDDGSKTYTLTINEGLMCSLALRSWLTWAALPPLLLRSLAAKSTRLAK